MKYVYLVTSGEYSGYQVHSAWSTSDLAEKEAARLNSVNKWDRADVEMLYLDLPTDDDRPLWRVGFFNGNVSAEQVFGGPTDLDSMWIGGGRSWGSGFWYVFAADEDSAIKIAAERRASAMAAYPPANPGRHVRFSFGEEVKP